MPDRHPLVATWRIFLEDLRSGDDRRCQESFQAWISQWDRCFWDEDFTAFPDIYAPDVRVTNRTVIAFLFDGFTGIDGFRRIREEASDVFSKFSFEVHRFQASGDRFAAMGSMGLRGRASGLRLRVPGGAVWTIRDGRIASIDVFASRGRVMRALDEGPGGTG